MGKKPSPQTIYGYEVVQLDDLIDTGRESYVYFIQGVDGGLVKIGTTNSIRDRLEQLQSGSPVRLTIRRLLRIPRSHGYMAEGDFHRRFAHLREYGEWFRVEGDLIAASNAIPSAREQAFDRLAEAVGRLA